MMENEDKLREQLCRKCKYHCLKEKNDFCYNECLYGDILEVGADGTCASKVIADPVNVYCGYEIYLLQIYGLDNKVSAAYEIYQGDELIGTTYSLSDAKVAIEEECENNKELSKDELFAYIRKYICDDLHRIEIFSDVDINTKKDMELAESIVADRLSGMTHDELSALYKRIRNAEDYDSYYEVFFNTKPPVFTDDYAAGKG